MQCIHKLSRLLYLQESQGWHMSEVKDRRSNKERRQAAPINHFPILDSDGNFIEHDRRSGEDRREDPRTTLQFIRANDLLEKFAELDPNDSLG